MLSLDPRDDELPMMEIGNRLLPLSTSKNMTLSNTPKFFGSKLSVIECWVAGSSRPLEGVAVKCATLEKLKSKGMLGLRFSTWRIASRRSKVGHSPN